MALLRTGSYDGTNPGLASFDLPNVYWDEIRFIGDNADVADATDFLVESISGDAERPELGGDSATGSGTKISVQGRQLVHVQQLPGQTLLGTTALTFRPETPSRRPDRRRLLHHEQRRRDLHGDVPPQ